MSSTAGIEWAITASFYVAVHYVQAYFAPHNSYTSHRQRDSAIQRDTKIQGIYMEYRELETYSRDARYDVPGFGPSDLAIVKSGLARVKACIEPLL